METDKTWMFCDPSLSILQDSHTGDNVVFQTAVCQAEVNCFSLTPPQFVSPTLSIVLITRLNRHLQIQVLKKYITQRVKSLILPLKSIIDCINLENIYGATVLAA